MPSLAVRFVELLGHELRHFAVTGVGVDRNRRLIERKLQHVIFHLYDLYHWFRHGVKHLVSTYTAAPDETYMLEP